MEPEVISQFLEQMTKEVLRVGKFARESQGTVQNTEKDHELTTDADPEFIQRRGRAKTVIDERSQEMLLGTLQNNFPHPVRIDAEEDTLLKTSLHTENAPVTVVIDPIDGTLEYFQGEDGYSVNVALVGNGRVLCALVYYPSKNILYLLDADRKSYACVCENDTIVRREVIIPMPDTSVKKVFCNNRVSEEGIGKLKQNFSVVRDIDGVVKWPDALLGCISGEYRTALFVRPQIRDVLFGAMIQSLPGGYAVDFAGNTIIWPDGGRIPEVVFGFGEFSEEIKRAFQAIAK